MSGNAEMPKKYVVPVNTMTLPTMEDWDRGKWDSGNKTYVDFLICLSATLA